MVILGAADPQIDNLRKRILLTNKAFSANDTPAPHIANLFIELFKNDRLGAINCLIRMLNNIKHSEHTSS